MSKRPVERLADPNERVDELEAELTLRPRRFA